MENSIIYDPYNDLDLLPEGQEVQVMDLSDCEGEPDPLLLAQGEMSSDPLAHLYARSLYKEFLSGGWFFERYVGMYRCLCGPDVWALHGVIMWGMTKHFWPVKANNSGDCHP